MLQGQDKNQMEKQAKLEDAKYIMEYRYQADFEEEDEEISGED